ncbi:hypothetical protein [Methylomonas sp. 11b]|uniref:hypothetical protein n=1 Tax=Methylomonas sp. 11b TaxID=1168169 RepID=UPI00047CF785|nr:hypothetical protein [Methylomonas sp. 11b]
MAIHSENTVKKLKARLKERYDLLITAMDGRTINPDEAFRTALPETHRVVAPDDVRIAVDDFSTILKEIKATLGKERKK